MTDQSMDITARPNIKELSRDELTELVTGMGQPAFRAGQIYSWLFHKDVDSFEEMTNLSKALRAELEAGWRVGRLEVEQTRESEDGTRKLLFRLDDGELIESVLIPEIDHWTLCLSTQVGCAMGCAFCSTGLGGFVRNLTPAEIIGQIQAAKRFCKSSDRPDLRLSNLVFMGMGEPLANLDNLVAAIGIITDPGGLALAWRRVTVSTVGLPDKLHQLIDRVKVRLAISLHAPDDETRDQLVPVNRTHNLAELMAACRKLPLRQGERITFEYVMLAGVNDSVAQARSLIRLLQGVPAKVNLIPFNEHPDSPFQRSDGQAVLAFQSRLRASNVTAFIRRSMGRDILAACGQLRGHALDGEQTGPEDQD